MKLLKYLSNLGYGSRREVARLFADGLVRDRAGQRLLENSHVAPEDVWVDGTPLDPAPGVVVMLHKPVGYVCSTRSDDDLVYRLLPPRFVRRSPVVAPVGRLDRDTSGLLLLTDDGALNHRMTAPRSHVPKTYEVTLATDLRGDEATRLSEGTLMLESEQTPLKPANLEVLTPRLVRVTITEGRYHHVRRMFAALGNHVLALHRVAVGSMTLDTLPQGAWRILTAAEIAHLSRSSTLSSRAAP